jgi:hypothetical protein
MVMTQHTIAALWRLMHTSRANSDREAGERMAETEKLAERLEWP